jgi:hypothetical protein
MAVEFHKLETLSARLGAIAQNRRHIYPWKRSQLLYMELSHHVPGLGRRAGLYSTGRCPRSQNELTNGEFGPRSRWSLSIDASRASERAVSALKLWPILWLDPARVMSSSCVLELSLRWFRVVVLWGLSSRYWMVCELLSIGPPGKRRIYEMSLCYWQRRPIFHRKWCAGHHR